MKTIVAAVCILASIHGANADAWIEPSFSELDCTWLATDVVVATQTAGGSDFVVAKTWKGDLDPGQHIAIDDITGARVILFLRRDPKQQGRWLPAARHGGMRLSVVWIDGDSVSAFIQIHQGPPERSKLDLDYEAFTKRVQGFVDAELELKAANSAGDPRKRAELLAGFTRSQHYYVRSEAFRMLAQCGASSLPVLRQMLADESLLQRHGDVVRALADAGGDEVTDELVQLLNQEHAFWQQRAPDLHKGWWNGTGLPWSEVDDLRIRYTKVLEVINAFDRQPTAKCLDSVTRFRDFWRSLPQLEDDSGLTQMSQRCDNVLAKLTRS